MIQKIRIFLKQIDFEWFDILPYLVAMTLIFAWRYFVQSKTDPIYQEAASGIGSGTIFLLASFSGIAKIWKQETTFFSKKLKGFPAIAIGAIEVILIWAISGYWIYISLP